MGQCRRGHGCPVTPSRPASVTQPGADVPLPRTFFDRPVLEVAPDLLGRVLWRHSPGGAVAVRLTEVEAYDGENDPGSHAYRGLTRRNAVMFGEPGHVYVYFTYGMHFCMNLVCGPGGQASAVLLRAGEVVVGESLARRRRAVRSGRDGTVQVPGSALPRRDLARGPARLAKALGVDTQLNGADACGAEGTVSVVTGEPVDRTRIATSPRTGVAGAGAARAWRYYVDADPTVSPYRPAVARRRRVRDSGA